jgi:hypothetical protein
LTAAEADRGWWLRIEKALAASSLRDSLEMMAFVGCAWKQKDEKWLPPSIKIKVPELNSISGRGAVAGGRHTT